MKPGLLELLAGGASGIFSDLDRESARLAGTALGSLEEFVLKGPRLYSSIFSRGRPGMVACSHGRLVNATNVAASTAGVNGVDCGIN